jgi:hypothetical protein
MALREELIDSAVKFLKHPKIVDADMAQKVSFLQKKVRACASCSSIARVLILRVTRDSPKRKSQSRFAALKATMVVVRHQRSQLPLQLPLQVQPRRHSRHKDSRRNNPHPVHRQAHCLKRSIRLSHNTRSTNSNFHSNFHSKANFHSRASFHSTLHSKASSSPVAFQCSHRSHQAW